jgi:HEAT repeat protein
MKEEEQQRIVSALESTVEEIRYQAVRRLPEAFDKLPIQHLMRALGDESWRVRKCASEVFTQEDASPELIKALVKALGEEDNAGLRNSATEVLIKIGSPAVADLFNVLKDGDKDERKIAADILGDVKDERALEPLLSTLKDPDENVRAAAAESLGILGDASVIERLVETLRDDGLVVQLSCLDALDRLNAEVPTNILASFMGVGPLRPHLYRLMGNLRDKSVIPKLLEGLQARGRGERAAAALALVRQYRMADKRARVEVRVAVARAASDQVITNLRALLDSSVAEEQEGAVAVLGWTGRPDVVADLIRAASDESLREPVREAILSIGPKSSEPLSEMLDELGRTEKVLALDILGHFGQPAALSRIIDLCLSSDVEVAEAAQRSLGKIGNPSVISTLTELICRESHSPPKGAVASLVLLGAKYHDQVLAAVRPMLDESSPGLRVTAAEVICGIAHKTDLDEVNRLIGDEDPEVRVAAVRSMGRVGGNEAVEKLRVALTDESPKVRGEAARALGNRDTPEAKKALKIALRDGDPWVVRASLVALGQGGAANPEVVDSILSFINHSNGAVALEAVRALNRLGWRGDINRLVEASRHPDPEVVKEVLAGCDRWPVDDVRAVIVGALSDPHWDVRVAAVRKIGAMKDPVAIQAVYERLNMEGDELVKEAMEQVLQMGERGATDG